MLQCGGWSLDMGSQAPADAEESSALDPSISHAETSSTGVLSQSPPPTPHHFPHSPQVRGSKDSGHQSSLGPAQVLSVLSVPAGHFTLP